jgi:hypothetical protein
VTPDPALAAKLVATARATADTRGWSWEEPVVVTVVISAPGQRTWSVRSNASAIGRNVVITIREADLAVLEAVFLPR